MEMVALMFVFLAAGLLWWAWVDLIWYSHLWPKLKKIVRDFYCWVWENDAWK